MHIPKQKCKPVERKTCFHVLNAFSSRLELIWVINIQAENIQNVQKTFLTNTSPKGLQDSMQVLKFAKLTTNMVA